MRLSPSRIDCRKAASGISLPLSSRSSQSVPCPFATFDTACIDIPHTNLLRQDPSQHAQAVTIPVSSPSDDTLLLTRAALWGLRRIYGEGYEYQKTGVMLMNLLPAGVISPNSV